MARNMFCGSQAQKDDEKKNPLHFPFYSLSKDLPTKRKKQRTHMSENISVQELCLRGRWHCNQSLRV